jgi:hypothetical protein
MDFNRPKMEDQRQQVVQRCDGERVPDADYGSGNMALAARAALER